MKMVAAKSGPVMVGYDWLMLLALAVVWGLHEIASGLASILNATTPLFTVLAAHMLTQTECARMPRTTFALNAWSAELRGSGNRQGERDRHQHAR
jgi:hypothetical protein